MPHKETLETLAAECPAKGKWCFLREFLLHAGLDDRTLAQARIMFDFRYMLGVWDKREYSDQESFDLYVTKGYAKRFADIYDSPTNVNIGHEELFYKMFIEQEKLQPYRTMQDKQDRQAGGNT